jgi:hypothetical protein
LRRPDGLNALPFSMIYEIISQGSLRLASEDSLYDFIKKRTETKPEMFSLLEFVSWEYCSTDVMNDFFNLLSEHFYEMNDSMWANLRARLVLPRRTWKQFPPTVKKGKKFDVPDGIIAHLTRECGGNVHDHHVVEVTWGSFEKETHGLSVDPDYSWAAKNAADLETDLDSFSAYREEEEDILHTRNNWLCYDFKERRIVPTHYAIRTDEYGPGATYLKSWAVDTSADGESWREVAREEGNKKDNGHWFTGTFVAAGGGECRFIRLVNIGRNHYGDDSICISAWEIFGSLVE